MSDMVWNSVKSLDNQPRTNRRFPHFGLELLLLSVNKNYKPFTNSAVSCLSGITVPTQQVINKNMYFCQSQPTFFSSFSSACIQIGLLSPRKRKQSKRS